MIKIYNTLTREKETFQPIKEKQVSMYVCGPTVYNYIHIGNARSTVAFDTVRRYFEYRGYDVNFVSNFTDVDDKIIRTAKEMGISAKEVAEKFIAAFYEDTAALQVEKATLNPRVMENIPDIIDFIRVLIEKGYAYAADGDVYYRTDKFKDYGKLSDQSIKDLIVGASERMDTEENLKKENPLDFALWKEAKPDEISWESPWGPGRPGWHIECSVMATKYLGNTIDIHGGGHDLAFPHHENEIAQSEAKTGQTFAHYWMHNGFVTIGEDAEKMSKSLGNFVLVHDIIKQVDPQVLRFFLATAHYRRPVKFSEKAVNEAKINLDKIKIAYQNAQYREQDAAVSLPEDAEKLAMFNDLKQEFIAEMDDDFQADNAMTIVYQYAKELNIYAEEETVSAAVLKEALATFKALVGIFGIVLGEEALLDDDIQALIDERMQARKDKNFARSDEIRDYLKDQGIILDDTSQGTRWRRA
ncbi:cysteinyl-trna synthetase/mycothiol ligase [Trichococcus palustris]|jgi:cysteinyl-tRNA synthetase|uniref:Cysteine--tRNA ligase n=1 Tax=Trichococcus palustris TaxID=140314 RepID=A0A143YYQ7_9LACT|nr:cysteine--tRNA ligase [Trichococcus palustris]CZR00776.1 cysteinyl-trna synthetase/mycothiol ligase [Trichococcus palustris]SFK90172.1 cysteinyl-tRNA synthetase [Trichococcus palustris]